jgi:hypothetical protein
MAALEARMAAIEQRGRRARGDDAALLSAIARVFGGRVWTGRDLRRMARTDQELAAALDGRSGRQLGAWLGRIRRHGPVGAYTLTRVKRDGPGALWTLVCDDRHTQRSHQSAASAR